VHLVPGSPAHVLLPLLVLFYDMFERINNQSINQKLFSTFFSTLTVVLNFANCFLSVRVDLLINVSWSVSSICDNRSAFTLLRSARNLIIQLAYRKLTYGYKVPENIQIN